MTEPASPAPASPEPQPRPPLHHRRWPWAVLGFILTLALLALLAPTLMSLGVARQYVLTRLNHHLNGRLEIGDWSLGWTGTELRDLRLFDAQQSEVFSVAHLKTDLSFWNLIHGRYALGTTQVEEPNFTQLVVFPDGTNNLQAILPPATPTRRGGGLTLRGDISVERLRATIVDRRDQSTLIVQPSTLSMKIQKLHDPIEYQLTLQTRTPQSTTAANKPSEREGTAHAPTALIEAPAEPLPIGPVTLAAADALLRTVGHGPTHPTTGPASTRPAPTTAPTSPRHHPRAARHPS